jgi:hypothetical protein
MPTPEPAPEVPTDDGEQQDVPLEPGSPGVVGEHPNQSDVPPGGEPAALDEHPDGMSPMQSDSDHGTTTPRDR